MPFLKRLCFYVTATVVATWLALLVWEIDFDERCGGSDCQILLIESLLVAVLTLGVSATVCFVVEVSLRARDRRPGR